MNDSSWKSFLPSNRNLVWLFCGILIGATFACVVYEVRLAYVRHRALQQLQEMFKESSR